MKATEVVERLKQRFPNEPEYIQAVSQVLDTIEMNTINIQVLSKPILLSDSVCLTELLNSV